jgi:hypothetical protein
MFPHRIIYELASDPAGNQPALVKERLASILATKAGHSLLRSGSEINFRSTVRQYAYGRGADES